MKKLLLTFAAFATAVHLYGQSTIPFRNDNSTPVMNSLTAARVAAGNAFLVSLNVAPDGESNPTSFVQVSAPIGFYQPGLFDGGNRAVPFPLPSSEYVMIEIKAWEAAYGGDFNTAVAAPPQNGRLALRGRSGILRVRVCSSSAPGCPSLSQQGLRSIFLTVPGSNTPPIISSIPNQTINEDTVLGPITFTVQDAETPAENLTLNGVSSNPDLVRSENISFGGTGMNRTVRVAPEPDGFGQATITLTAADVEGGTRSSSFLLTVTPVDDPTSIVTIRATDAQAAEAWSDPGTFTVRRSGATNFSQLIFYELSGSASNGVDYEQLPGTIQMPGGVTAVSFTVRPINDSLAEGTETVAARIIPSPLDCVTCGYDIGQPDVAEVFINDNDRDGTNAPPFIRLNSPLEGAVFTAPAEVALRAYAQDAEDRFFVKVEFFEGANSLGFGVFEPSTCPAPYCPYFALTWSNVPPRDYTLSARATDSTGLISTSAVTHVAVYYPDRPRSGLYRINSGTFSACCGIGGNDLGYELPADSQSFVRLNVDVQNNTASMSFLRDDARSVFNVVPCPPSPVIPMEFEHGLVFSNRIVFHVDPAFWYWNYSVSNSADTLYIDGVLGVVQRFCADAPDKFSHSNVVATLLPPPPRIESIERQGNRLRFNFAGEPPYDYFVEYSQSLPAQSWLSLTNFRAKLGTIQAVVVDPVTNSAARFYRIRKEPCLCRTP